MTPAAADPWKVMVGPVGVVAWKERVALGMSKAHVSSGSGVDMARSWASMHSFGHA